MNFFLKDNYKKKLKYISTLAVIGGGISDITQPIAPFALYIFFLSLILLVIFYFLKRKIIILEEYNNYLIIISIVSFFIFGFQKISGSEEKGLLASNFPVFENFQSTLGIIKEDIKSIKKDVEDIAKSNQQISKNTDQIAKGISEMNTNLKNINNDENLKIFKNPKTAMEFYSNAKFYELKGDFLNAKQSYIGFFKFKVEVYEPYLNFIELLKIQEGNLIAKENFEILINKYPTKIANVLSNRFLGSYDERLKFLNNFISKNPDYLPAYLELFYVYKNKKELTFNELNQLKNNLEKIILALEKGKLNPFFIDKKLNIKLLEEIKPFYNNYSKKISQNIPKTYFDIEDNMDGNQNTSNLIFSIEMKEKFSDLHLILNNETIPVTLLDKNSNLYGASIRTSNEASSDMNLKRIWKYKDASGVDVEFEDKYKLTEILSEYFMNEVKSFYKFRCTSVSIYHDMSQTHKIPFNRVSWGNGYYFNLDQIQKNGSIKLLLSIYNNHLKLGTIEKVSVQIDNDKPIVIEEYFKDKDTITHLVRSFEKNFYMKGIGTQLNYFGIAIGKKFEKLKVIFYLKNGQQKIENINFKDLVLVYDPMASMTNQQCLDELG